MENARPTPLWALELGELPTDHHFRRDHFGVPELDPAGWRLEVAGAVEQPLSLSLAQVQALPAQTLKVVLECAGHRRTELDPPAEGIPWGAGAVGEARWAGAPLRELLALARPSRRAAAAVLEGADRGPFAHLAGEFSFARCLPLAKALDRDTLLAWQMNGAPLPAAHGAPLRAVVPGWYATDSVKWLVRIELIEGEYDGPFEALDYRLGDDRLTELPVHALVTSPAEGAEVIPGPLDVGGVAWGGRGGGKAVEVRIDGGDWDAAACDPPAGPYALTRWRARVELSPGGRTIAVRATDGAGRSQPETPLWNPRGYANASVHRVRVRVRAERDRIGERQAKDLRRPLEADWR